MIQVKLFFCADSAVIDGTKNTISAFHILEQAVALSFPTVVPRVAVIGSFTRELSDPDRLELTLSVVLGGRQIYSGPFRVLFFQQTAARAVVEMQGIIVTAPGDLVFRLLDGQNEFASWSVSIIGGNQTQAVQMVFGVPEQPQAPSPAPQTAAS